MSSSKRNTETCLVRFWINVIKVSCIAVALGAMVFFGSRPLDSESQFYWSFFVILGASSLSALIVVSLESFEVPRALVLILGILSVIAVGMELWNGYNEQWVRGQSPYVLIFFLLVFFCIQIILSANDKEVDTYMSQYDYPNAEIRRARFVVYLAWNALPYLTFVWMAWFIAIAYSVSTVVKFSLCVTALLLGFCILDEYLRHRFHWSFFWHNTPVKT